ncbi:uncharacterized protein EV422DRAFT_79508 [Fimicolochytrium jonesii]|uniref:uncharacterized protein n=1 Tax=Fimicolochytrium jonesii TaxID=1396493 RepID=UPI0022FF0FDB|nr:uncharacterized protein EV422DRAFT_79508 [Fimicolochytrium jonesii]KAI8820121.1 hypothetical protein EV422DRAFT_79508 [Fimicolochytrium jonesii]
MIALTISLLCFFSALTAFGRVTPACCITSSTSFASTPSSSTASSSSSASSGTSSSFLGWGSEFLNWLAAAACACEFMSSILASPKTILSTNQPSTIERHPSTPINHQSPINKRYNARAARDEEIGLGG